MGNAAEIGTNFGKQGTLVENPGIKVDCGQFSKHGLGRILERNVTTDQVNEWVRTGKVLQQGVNKYLFITKDGAAVVAEGKLVTVMSKYDYDEAMEVVVKALFGD
ncbi:hypothetical protein [Candidatus Clostridium radicumherbarum]|uniref:Profilin n=1 Tax=Candidatus Clostridium radicumherbarum TaxID=3381662 RepID=A0ABW8TM43_9CLOT